MTNILSATIEAIVESKGIEFVDIYNPADEEKINQVFAINPEKPILLFGFSNEEELKNNIKIATVLARNNCVYIKLPCKIELIKDAIKELGTKSQGQTAVALEEFANLQEIKRQVGYIKHLKCYKEGITDEILKLAEEKLGWKGSGTEIVDRLANFQPKKEIAKNFGGKTIPGVFCDIEGTLFDWDGNLNQEIVSMLEKYEAEGKTVCLWTGGDLKNISIKIKKLKWQLLSKYAFENCRMEIIIDDLPEKELQKEYGIQAEYYIHWDPDEIWS